ncbi:centriole, cilia and spindle-associated protein [Esox lucius]|uniref:centriole, cilia and spindle-associated protein n=1 Tax=Esox lucius TaxID=8010 RepID=UPI0014768DB5|nr:centriole, cilia and spindle-associated protein [Esox lucius]XP_010887531.2 centriole, cilia and spindle-associated protein [Esox lucius]XP_019905048.2 centriole, cilia and spindle-associated protein [Esox lucius]XP_034150402.1 centriole, cilia and spindle-associated protein [Esox lucius]
MLSKKIRTEYMKKFKEPKWETFSKCYEESVKYRLTRRVMEHAHKPLWFWEGWDTSTGSDSSASGRSTPKMRNKVVPVDVRPETPSLKSELRESPEPKHPFVNGELELEAKEFTLLDALPPTAVVIENGSLNDPDEGAVGEAAAQNRMAAESTTDEGPAEKTSSDEEPAKEPKRRHRTPRAELCHRDGSRDEIRPGPVRKPSRAKSQPPALTTEKENQRSSARLDWSERQASSARRSTNESRTSDTFVQSRRGSNKRATNLDRRRARSADLEKIRQAELTVVDDRWMTEYMRCFSARLR